MGTQFLLSLIGGAVAGGGLLFMAGKYAYKWYKKEPITISHCFYFEYKIWLSLLCIQNNWINQTKNPKI